jgi:phosphoribosylanthranilate isomerase
MIENAISADEVTQALRRFPPRAVDVSDVVEALVRLLG